MLRAILAYKAGIIKKDTLLSSTSLIISSITLQISMATANLSYFKALSLLTLALSIYSTWSYPFKEDPTFTPFTSVNWVITIYWLVTYISQIAFVNSIFLVNDGSYNLTGEITSISNPIRVLTHFSIFNVAHMVWSILFFKHHYFLSLLVAGLNFLQILTLLPLKTTKLVRWPVISLPLSWLMYTLFWNGALWLGTNGTFGRIIANVFIWDFLIVGFVILMFYDDYAIGLSTSFLLLGIGWGQLVNKLFSLQWIFGFINSGLLFLLSVGTMVKPFHSSSPTIDETRPLTA